jgi:hypothetical protein
MSIIDVPMQLAESQMLLSDRVAFLECEHLSVL